MYFQINLRGSLKAIVTRDIPIQTSLASAQHLDWLYSPRSLISEGHVSPFLWLKQPKRVTDRKLSFNADVMSSCM